MKFDDDCSWLNVQATTYKNYIVLKGHVSAISSTFQNSVQLEPEVAFIYVSRTLYKPDFILFQLK